MSAATGGASPSPGREAVADLSFIVVTDTYETIRVVIDCLRRQTIKHRVEAVVVAASAEAVKGVQECLGDLAAVQIVEVGSIEPLGQARVAGIRAASAPLVYLGETHSYPAPGLAEAIVAAHRRGWDAVTPRIENANPSGRFSWAGFIGDYGPWIKGGAAQEIGQAPPHNASFRRALLLELGERLAPALMYGDELALWMRARGCRAYFEPAALTAHANVSRPWAWIRERWAFGRLVASYRGRRWPLSRRVAYVFGAPLIPVVLVWRTLPAMRETGRQVRLPWGTLPLLVASAVIRAAGELTGYAGAPTRRAELEMHDIEIHRLAYIGDGEL